MGCCGGGGGGAKWFIARYSVDAGPLGYPYCFIGTDEENPDDAYPGEKENDFARIR